MNYFVRMKALTFGEFHNYVFWCEDQLLQAQLQDSWAIDCGLVMEFYKYRSFWLVLDLESQIPSLILLQNAPPKEQKKKKPVSLFLQSHGKNLRLESFQARPQWGRVAQMRLVGGASLCELDLQLLPRGANVLVQAVTEKGLKKVSWIKEVELTEVQDRSTEPGRTGEEIALELEQAWWNKGKKNSSTTSGLKKTDTNTRALEKKKKALKALQEQVESHEATELRKYANHLQSFEEIPTELLKYDSSLPKNEKIQKAFQRAKLLEAKKAGTEKRILQIETEIASLEARLARGESENPDQQVIKPSQKALAKADASVRRIKLDQGFEAVCGKSARDNLSILRQARAWDFWLHLKDYPGAHAIIFREREQVVPLKVIEQVSQWLMRESKAARGSENSAKWEVLVAECRFVRPIKGDQLGRVNYRNEKVYSFSRKPA